jgi:hypothetical protein
MREQDQEDLAGQDPIPELHDPRERQARGELAGRPQVEL